ncbi:hypothetical protein DB88DRAFT_209572 [Papiliotrema laurentii]|uniref:Uncharacterized protein n=1 Tax=Papiliotrema laurentii TaxID=5418 RepID=A0AAD9FT05_PAPLA|nr:hypothetical protein DB88DRAFT_209572 [Papiliotrema laurentii]
MTGETLRQSDGDRVAMDLKPDALKSGTEQVTDQAKLAGDALGSMVPGQEKARDHFTDNAATPSLTHDHGRAGVTESLKPAGAQSTGEAVQQKFDQAASYLQPEKSKTQEVKDALTPGNHSVIQGEGGGIVQSAGEALHSVKETIAGAFGGGPGTQHEAR